MKFKTVGELINTLNKFPKETEIVTEIALLWTYPDSLKDLQKNMDSETYSNLTMNKAEFLGIFEGSWEKDNISNVDGKIEWLLDK